jgi:hypothetical protein
MTPATNLMVSGSPPRTRLNTANAAASTATAVTTGLAGWQHARLSRLSDRGKYLPAPNRVSGPQSTSGRGIGRASRRLHAGQEHRDWPRAAPPSSSADGRAYDLDHPVRVGCSRRRSAARKSAISSAWAVDRGAPVVSADAWGTASVAILRTTLRPSSSLTRTDLRAALRRVVCRSEWPPGLWRL